MRHPNLHSIMDCQKWLADNTENKPHTLTNWLCFLVGLNVLNCTILCKNGFNVVATALKSAEQQVCGHWGTCSSDTPITAHLWLKKNLEASEQVFTDQWLNSRWLRPSVCTVKGATSRLCICVFGLCRCFSLLLFMLHRSRRERAPHVCWGMFSKEPQRAPHSHALHFYWTGKGRRSNHWHQVRTGLRSLTHKRRYLSKHVEANCLRGVIV